MYRENAAKPYGAVEAVTLHLITNSRRSELLTDNLTFGVPSCSTNLFYSHTFHGIGYLDRCVIRPSLHRGHLAHIVYPKYSRVRVSGNVNVAHRSVMHFQRASMEPQREWRNAIWSDIHNTWRQDRRVYLNVTAQCAYMVVREPVDQPVSQLYERP